MTFPGFPCPQFSTIPFQNTPHRTHRRMLGTFHHAPTLIKWSHKGLPQGFAKRYAGSPPQRAQTWLQRAGQTVSQTVTQRTAAGALRATQQELHNRRRTGLRKGLNKGLHDGLRRTIQGAAARTTGKLAAHPLCQAPHFLVLHVREPCLRQHTPSIILRALDSASCRPSQ